MSHELSAKYDPSQVEDKWYGYWTEHKLFASHPDNRPPYTVVIPPPNVTGVLHMGHMLNNTLQDILVRRARMTGFNACWVPGTDHASIATEAKVVAKLAKKGIKKSDLTREQFLNEVWDWTHEHGGIIISQLKKIGASCDWDRLAFTMDEQRSETVNDVFCDLYRKGLIYRGIRMVNWDPAAKTAISDEEVIHKAEHSKLYYVRYPIVEDPEQYVLVATTRPETIFGDAAVCINPSDERYTHLKGKHVIVPGVGRETPIIMDDYVDIDFGTGCLKITPCHDINDYAIGERYHLPKYDVFNDDGTLNGFGGKYEGCDRFEVRDAFAAELEEIGAMDHVEDYDNTVGFSERTDVPIEPKLSTQWFLRMDHFVKPAYEAVMKDEVSLVPPKFKSIYAHWMENIHDWNISRQLYWGHRIPAYYLPDGQIVVGESRAVALEEAHKIDPALTDADLKQDEDTLDTWFSSWLWPMSVFANPIKDPENAELQYYYPTSTLVSGPDILFFWVARMIMAGYEYMGKKPFGDVYLTGIVRDHQGRKMSKQLGNSPDPLLLIKEYGADGVRMGLMSCTNAGNDILFDESMCEQGRNFSNKIWNSYRLVQGWEESETAEQSAAQAAAVRWFAEVLSDTRKTLDDHFAKYRISDAMMLLYRVVKDDFSGTYLELVKPDYGKPIDSTTLAATKDYLEQLLLLLHPFMPFITEELWQNLADRADGESIMMHQLPAEAEPDQEILHQMALSSDIITGVRGLRAHHGVSPREAVELLMPEDRLTDASKAVIRKLANISDFTVAPTSGDAEVETFLVETTVYGVPFRGLIDISGEIEKLRKDIKHYTGFIAGIEKKLSNPGFVNNAPQAVVDMERKKVSDATEKLKSAQERLDLLEQQK